MTNEQLETLAVRVESLQGPDREVDQDIHELIVIGAVGLSGRPYHWAQRYTASIDAALTLVPEGLHWTGQTDRDGAVMTIGKADSDARGIFYTDCKHATAKTPALALTAAALRARKTT